MNGERNGGNDGRYTVLSLYSLTLNSRTFSRHRHDVLHCGAVVAHKAIRPRQPCSEFTSNYFLQGSWRSAMEIQEQWSRERQAQQKGEFGILTMCSTWTFSIGIQKLSLYLSVVASHNNLFRLFIRNLPPTCNTWSGSSFSNPLQSMDSKRVKQQRRQ